MYGDHTDYCRQSNSVMFEEVDENLDPQIHISGDENQNFDELLINILKSYPHLYDTSSKDYRDACEKENSWVEIAKVLNTTPDACCNRWTRLRESFSKEKKKRQIETKSGSGATKRKGFAYFESMKFIEKFVRTRSVINNTKFKVPSATKVVDRNTEILEWVQQGNTISEEQNWSPKKIVNNSIESVRNWPGPSTAPSASNYEETVSVSSISTSDSAINNEFAEQSVSSESSKFTIESPMASPTLSDTRIASPAISECSSNFKKPSSLTKGRFNPYIPIRKQEKNQTAENDDFGKSFITLNKAVALHLEQKKEPNTSIASDPDTSFCSLVAAELKAMIGDEKVEKKREIMQILWRKWTP